ncbi:MAG: CoA ester lyase [Erythrobacter sp.]
MFAAATLLFVPGSRPDRFDKAKDAGADLTIIDLEDAVADGDKETAREAALNRIGDTTDGWAIRINAPVTKAGIRDLAALIEADTLPSTILVPMVEARAHIEIVAGVLGEDCPDLVALVETPRGLRHAVEIANHPRIVAMMFGGADFAGELGIELAWEPLFAARAQFVLACAETGKAAIDVPFVSLDDEAGLKEECERARAIGFGGKAAIHPRQLPAIRNTFMPSDGEVAEAREALAAYEDAGRKAIRHKGRMLEAPFIRKYRAVVERAERTDQEQRNA